MKRGKKLVAKARKGKKLSQVAALPYRHGNDGRLEFMLVTSRQTKRVVIPKGWPIKRKSASRAAASEAEEEAGVVGKRGKRPIGRFQYWKRLRSGFVPIVVTVFPLEVEDQLEEWPERKIRRRAWLSPEDAACLVDEPQLASLLQEAAERLGG
jgi:8-oxo-dGTP pyrophosphatase MutT (NUDIX family)